MTCTLDFDWALKLRTTYPELFDLRSHLEGQTDDAIVPRSGQLWFALPDGAFVRLCDRPCYPRRHCPGYLVAGKWMPLREQPAGPMAMKLIVNERPGQSPSIDPWHKRPGILLGDSHAAVAMSSPRNSPPSLLQYGCALWIKGQSESIELHGQVSVLTPTDKLAHYQLWAAWGISTSPGQELLRLAPDEDLSECRPVFGSKPILPSAADLFAEMLGLHPWRGSRLPPKVSRWPERGDVVLVRLSPQDRPVAPCLVVSPAELNSRNDLVVLRCIPYRDHHVDQAILVPLPSDFIEDGQRWTVALPLLRGIGRADRFWRFCTPAYNLRGKPEFAEVDARLKDLYA